MRFVTFLKVEQIIDFKAIILICVLSSFFSMVILFFERCFILESELKEEVLRVAPRKKFKVGWDRCRDRRGD